MKFHSLMAAALLVFTFDSAAALVRPEGQPGAAQAIPAPLPASDGERPVYQNGDLVLDIRDTLGVEVVRSSLAYFFHDAHIDTVNELPLGPVDHITAKAETVPDEAPGAAALPEPVALALLGGGLALLGWTRRPGGAASKPQRRHSLLSELVPWPGLPWLD